VVAGPEGPTNNRHYRETRQCRRLVSGLGQWPVPPAERRRLRFSFQNQQCQRAGSKSGTSVPIRTRRAARFVGHPALGARCLLDPLLPVNAPPQTFAAGLSGRCGEQQLSAPALNLTAADVFRLTRGSGFYGTAILMSTGYFATGCRAQNSMAAPKARPSLVPSYPERTRNMTRFNARRKGEMRKTPHLSTVGRGKCGLQAVSI